MTVVVVVMGVSGSGKTTVARAASAAFGWDLGEGDALHPRANVEKMHAGVPLTDADRVPWLRAVRSWIDQRIDEGHDGVISCSALRRVYRDVLRRPEVLFVLLDGDRTTLAARMGRRSGHFMPASLLDSQLQTLERPDTDERAITLSITTGVQDQLAEIRAAAGG